MAPSFLSFATFVQLNQYNFNILCYPISMSPSFPRKKKKKKASQIDFQFGSQQRECHSWKQLYEQNGPLRASLDYKKYIYFKSFSIDFLLFKALLAYLIKTSSFTLKFRQSFLPASNSILRNDLPNMILAKKITHKNKEF